MKKIDTYTVYWQEIVTPDLIEFQNATDDLRLAFHLAISLFYMSDWVYKANKIYTNNRFKFYDKNDAIQPVHDEKSFANAVKHLQLRQISKANHSHMVSHADNIVSQSTGYGLGGYGEGPYSGTKRIMLQDPGGIDLDFLTIARSVHQMWINLANKHNWQL